LPPRILIHVLGHDELTDTDIDNINAFKFLMVANIPRTAFNQMRFSFRHKMEIHSIYVITHRLALLSEVVPLWYDCCINSCIAYTGDYVNDLTCPYCKQPRHNAKNKPRRMFCYIPIIPRLQKLFSNIKSREELLYRHEYHSDGSSISDVFDGEHYKNLCKTRVSVDGKIFLHKYFSDKRDIAFSVCMDSYLLYKRRRGGPSATPILIQLYNLPPDVRTHLSRLVCTGVIPGPKGPKRLDTFVFPLEEEIASLAVGVPTYDCVEKSIFLMRGYHLFPQGDIIAIEKALGIKGHNSKCPCRGCEQKAINDPNATNKTYYIPLMHPNQTKSWDPHNLPLRSHNDWAASTERISQLVTKKDKNIFSQHFRVRV